MALGADEATFNAAVDTLWAAWEAVMDTMSAKEEFPICWVRSRKSHSLSAANAETYGDDATDTGMFDTSIKHWHKYMPDIDDQNPLEIGGKPLFFKITNLAGDLS